MSDPGTALAHPVAEQLLREQPLLRLSYTGRDGAPRVIPVAYAFATGRFHVWTIPGSAKVRALRADPRTAIVIDVVGPPPRLLLVRGRAELTTVEGVPAGYLDASHRTLPVEAWADFDAQVHALYDSMVAITITPDWAKLIDFETNAPSAVEALVSRGSQPPRP